MYENPVGMNGVFRNGIDSYLSFVLLPLKKQQNADDEHLFILFK